MKTLDLDAVAAFVLVADFRSFTRAAEAAGTTQSAISLKLKRLPAGAVDIGPTVPLPELPVSEVVLHSRVFDPQLSGALRVLAASFRSAGRQTAG
jgi:Bacterial regulatory helix-turn-helix protein, lysR family